MEIDTILKDLLPNVYNLILTGAPGTGKTLLAKKIAQEITHDKKENSPYIGFCQFHPSYDYTDFVEGLRPTPPDKKNGNVGFKRQDGVFMSFCRNAVLNSKSEQSKPGTESSEERQDNFEEAWNKLLDYLKDKKIVPVKYKQKEGFFDLGFNIETRNGKAQKAGLGIYNYQTEEEKKNHETDNLLSHISHEQLYNVYRNKPGVPSDAHKSYREAVINMMKSNFELKDYRGGNQSGKQDNTQKYVFIIDEINRGDIAKIFGELFYAIDPGYRGPKGKIATQYAILKQNNNDSEDPFKEGFYVPDNVYIIGTMNDIDRNVESMDFAIRRRFTWKEIKPKDTQKAIFAEIPDYAAAAEKRMNAVNDTICETEGLGSAYQLGAAYFLKLKHYKGNPEKRFEQLWDYNIEPLLNEYLRGFPKAKETLDKLSNAWRTGISPTRKNNTAATADQSQGENQPGTDTLENYSSADRQ